MRLISFAKYMVVIISILGMTSCIDDEQPVYNPVHNQTGGGNDDNPENPDDEEEEDVDIDLSKWELAWEENFDGTDRESLKENGILKIIMAAAVSCPLAGRKMWNCPEKVL